MQDRRYRDPASGRAATGTRQRSQAGDLHHHGRRVTIAPENKLKIYDEGLPLFRSPERHSSLRET